MFQLLFVFLLMISTSVQAEEISWLQWGWNKLTGATEAVGNGLIEIGEGRQAKKDNDVLVKVISSAPQPNNGATPEMVNNLTSIDSNGKKTNELLSGGVKTTEHMGLLKQTTCVIGIASGSVYIVKNLCDLGRWTYSFFRKKSVEELQQEALHNEQVSQQLKILTAQNRKDDFVRCCRRCRQAAKDIDGTPLACRKDAQAFLDATSEEEYCKVRNELLAH